MTRIFVFAMSGASALVALGCSSSVRYAPVHTGDRPGFIIECRRGLVDCYSKANELCPGGYDVMGSGSAGSESSSASVPVGNSMFVSQSTHEASNLGIACKGSAAPHAEAQRCTDSNDCHLGYQCRQGACLVDSSNSGGSGEKQP